MWSLSAENLKAILGLGIDNLADWIGWPVVTNPFFLILIAAIVVVLVLRKMDKALVAFMSGLALIVLCKSTLVNTTVAECYGDKLPVFVFAALVLAALNVYYLLVRN
jgi:hypothetical protein